MKTPQQSLGRVAWVWALIMTGSAWGCGLTWDKPHAHYDGLDERGHALVVETLGTLNLASGEALPLYGQFQSDWQNSSPYLGQGWMLALLDSRIVQVDDNTFLLWQPNGWYQHMGRDKPEDTILNGQGGWKAVIEGNKITAWATCGWKLTYENGKITSMTTPKNDELDMVYKNGRISDVVEKGSPILTVETDPNTGLTSGLTVNGQKIGLTQGDKPVVQMLGDKSVIGLMAQSLNKITYPDGTTKSFQYKVTDKVEPLLIADGRTIQWDAASQLITKDGDWNYQITPQTDSPLPQIARTNAKGQSESYFENPTTGITTVQGIDGVQRITTTFVNAGPLSGRVRSVTQIKDGVTTVLRKCDYDENGRLIRSIEEANVFQYNYNQADKLVRILKNGKEIANRSYDAQGRVVSEDYLGIHALTIQYSPTGQIRKIFKSSDVAALDALRNVGILLAERQSETPDITLTVDSSLPDVDPQLRKEGKLALQSADASLRNGNYKAAYDAYMNVAKQFGASDFLLNAQANYGVAISSVKKNPSDLTQTANITKEIVNYNLKTVPYKDQIALKAVQFNLLNLWFTQLTSGNLDEDIKTWKRISDQLEIQNANIVDKVLIHQTSTQLEKQLNGMFSIN